MEPYKLSSSLSGYQTANLEIEVPRDEQVSLSLDKGEDTSSPAPIFGSFGTRKAVIYGGIVTAFLVVLAIILVVIMAAPVPSSPMTLQQSVATAGNSSPVVQAPRPTLTPAARPTLAVTPTTSTTSPAHLVKQLKLPANNQVFEYRVVKPPMTVSWDVTPTMTTRDTCYENARGVFVCKDLTRIDENSIFTIRITDRDTNEIVLEDGFSPRFGTQLSKTQRIYRGGSFNISIDGRSIGVTLRIDQSY